VGTSKAHPGLGTFTCARLPLHRGVAGAVEPDLKVPLYGSPDAGSDDPSWGAGSSTWSRGRGRHRRAPGARLRAGERRLSHPRREHLGGDLWDAEAGCEAWGGCGRGYADGSIAGAGSGVSAAGTPVPSGGTGPPPDRAHAGV
jgi:hypothetical protein